ncbi:MAG: S8 family serine peptidase, partial [Phycisphaerae bacterium]|nr:S8 family serine peptidase [Phycisphaerae bacterium]
ISNNSIGTNTAQNGYPCEWEGDYGATAQLIDTIVRGDGSNPLFNEPFRVVWANGNERNSGRCGIAYLTTAPPACAKNHITVGAVNSNDDSVTHFTSWGPTDDGRLKPDIAAPGCQIGVDEGVTSCSVATDTAYSVMCGTSMASPTVCGLSALLLQDFRVHFPERPDFRNSTLKILLAHNAEDIENPGPDFKTGYGSVRIQRTVDFMRTGNFIEEVIDHGASYPLMVVVGEGDTQFKVTLAWDDVPGAVNTVPELVNDLDLRVFDPTGQQHFPWTLDPGDGNAPAVQTVLDHVNNIEQVAVSDPLPGVWLVDVYAHNVPQGPQPFSLCASPGIVDCTSQGFIALSKTLFGCDRTVGIRVGDCDLNTNAEAIETVTVTIASDSEPSGETVVLTETGPGTADFRGTILLSEINSSGVLQVADGDTLIATYIDADDGAGNFDVVVTTTALVDCQPPVISAVMVGNIGPEGATVTFNTDEPAGGTVRFGAGCDLLTESASGGDMVMSHSVRLSDLADATRYYFVIDAEDQQGNSGTDDNGGSCYSFSTPKVLYSFPLDTDPGWSVEGEWQFGPPTGGGSHNLDPTSGHTGDNVYGYNLNGDYPDNLPATYLTTTALNCDDLSDVLLKFRRWLGVESNTNYDEATVEVSNDGSNWEVIWSAEATGADVSDGFWRLVEYDISSIADDQPTVYIRWGMGPTDGGLTYPGWNIDDIQIVATGGPLSISFPDGLPGLFSPGSTTSITVRITENDENYVPGSGTAHYRYDGGAFQATPLTPLGGELYQAALPAPACDAVVEYYFSATGDVSGIVYAPTTVPSSVYTANVGQLHVVLEDQFETAPGWTIGEPDDGATTGIWNWGDPEGTDAQPEDDHTSDPGFYCYATGTQAGESLGTYDVDGGKTTLVSPTFDATGGEVTVGYWRWYSNITGANPDSDTFRVDISNDDGNSWANAETIGKAFGGPNGGGWHYHEFLVSEIISPTSTMKLRFVAEDDPSDGGGSLIEAAVDDILITRFVCETAEPSCEDGILNQGEDLIDCGGPCDGCNCLLDVDCTDDLFCTGAESCNLFGECVPGSYPCEIIEWCDESADACVPHGNGDFDGNDKVSLADFADFQVCFGTPTGLGCEPGNMTGTDEMINLADFAEFKNAFTGP